MLDGFKVAYYSDRGNPVSEDKGNEDTILIAELGGSQTEYLVAIVCDGMGGGLEGKLASSMTIKEILAVLEEVPENSTMLSVQKAIASALGVASSKINGRYKRDGVCATTCTAIVMDRYQFCFVHIGDSRLYIVSDGIFEQLSRDDTKVQLMVERGELTREEAKVHPHRHRLVKAVGALSHCVPFQSGVFELKDGLFLSSDGYWEFIEGEFAKEIWQSKALENVAQKMIKMGQRDNLSSILIYRD